MHSCVYCTASKYRDHSIVQCLATREKEVCSKNLQILDILAILLGKRKSPDGGSIDTPIEKHCLLAACQIGPRLLWNQRSLNIQAMYASEWCALL